MLFLFFLYRRVNEIFKKLKAILASEKGLKHIVQSLIEKRVDIYDQELGERTSDLSLIAASIAGSKSSKISPKKSSKFADSASTLYPIATAKVIDSELDATHFRASPLSSTLITSRVSVCSKNDGIRDVGKRHEYAKVVTKCKINFEEFYKLFYLNKARSNKKERYEFLEIYRECYETNKQCDGVYTKTMVFVNKEMALKCPLCKTSRIEKRKADTYCQFLTLDCTHLLCTWCFRQLLVVSIFFNFFKNI